MSAPAAHLRPMRWWDIPAVADLERDLFGPTAWSPAQFWSELAAPGRGYLVAEDDAGIAGYAGVAVLAPDADVQTVAVAGRAQGSGLGRLLTRSLLDRARGEGARRILLEVASGNAVARSLYASLGFVEISRRRGYYGPGEDAVVMQADLTARDQPGWLS